MKERKLRSLLKAVTWRVIAFSITSALAYLFTHKPLISISIGFLDSFIKVFVYFVHERLWLKVHFGIEKHPLEELPVKKPLTEKELKGLKRMIYYFIMVARDGTSSDSESKNEEERWKMVLSIKETSAEKLKKKRSKSEGKWKMLKYYPYSFPESKSCRCLKYV